MKYDVIFRFLIVGFSCLISLSIFVSHAGTDIELKQVSMEEGTSQQFLEKEDSGFTAPSRDQLPVLVESGQNGIITRIKDIGLIAAWVIKLTGGMLMGFSVDAFEKASHSKEANDTEYYDLHETEGERLFKSGLIMLSVASIFTVPHATYTLYQCIKNRCNGSSDVSHIEKNRSALEDLLSE
jgi:hypothetical protein